jgi:hypothetical protein
MPELVLLTLTRNEFLALSKAAEAGDQAALDAIKAMWPD